MEFLEPWEKYTDGSLNAEKELERELCKEHILFGIKAIAIAHRCDCDDVLFELHGFTHKYAIVHLTYSIETNPRYPSTELYESIESWISTRMIPDNKDYAY